MHHFNGRMLFPLPVENVVEIMAGQFRLIKIKE